MKPHSWCLPALNWHEIDALAAGKNIVIDSRKVEPGDLFLAFDGTKTDGRSYIPSAVAAGAAAVLWEEAGFQWDSAWQVPNLPIRDLRAQAGIIAAHLYGNPSRDMCAIGITGTNGKTSIAHWLAQAFEALGKRSVVIGTLGNGFLGQLTTASLTTPDAATVQMLLSQYRQQGASRVVMEVSSHALEQGRAHGMAFDIGVFTNLTRDHLDFHGSMQSYGQAKTRLFEWEGLQAAVVNADDAFTPTLLKAVCAPTVLRYGIKHGDIRALHFETSLSGIVIDVFTPWGEITLSSQVIGHFNIYNLLATLSTLLANGISLPEAAKVMTEIVPAIGRMQKIGGGSLPLVIIDYAHTPDALEKALSTLRESMALTGKLYCVFGCGGGRDRGKRPLMAEAVAAFADKLIVTSDNPRLENPEQIIHDIVTALPQDCECVAEIDRAKAISYAIKQATPQDVVLIAGKGHETYQEIGGKQYAFNDAEIAARQLAEWHAL
jgi:UDP-N-acetylmuramoyl-L-alanyl-D-glutamate--2,6-diaminopimelate ligase